MIDGEVYILVNAPKCVFAYRETTDGWNTHYICVNSNDEVKRYGDGCAGMVTRGATRLANDEQLARFTEYLQNSGYYWNKANKKVINIDNGHLY